VPSKASGGDALPSTKYEWKRVKVSRADDPGARSLRSKGDIRFFPRLYRGQALVLSLAYRGGAESKWLVIYRGRKFVLPGWYTIDDIMAICHGETRIP
jgi:hypothetical protein